MRSENMEDYSRTKRVPKNWTICYVKDLAVLTNGSAFNEDDWTNKGLPIIRIQNLNGSREFNFFDGDLGNHVVVEPGDLLFSWSGNRGTSFGPFVWSGTRGVLNQHIFKVTPKDDVEPGFLYQALQHVTEAIEQRAHGGTGIVHVRKSELESFPILLPPQKEQSKIVRFLNTLEDAIEATRAVIEQARRLKSALLQELLISGLPRKHNKFKVVKHLGRMPVAWDVRTINEVFEVQLGKMLSQAAKTGKAYRPYIGNWNVQWGRFDLNHVEQMDFTGDEFEKFVLQPGDILVCEGGEVGRTAIWKGEIESCCYQKALHRLRPRPSIKVIPEFFMYFMEQGTLRNIFLPFTGESSIAHLTRETLVQIPMPLPSYTEQEAIVAVLESVEARTRAEEMKLQQIEKAKAALSQGLLTGRIPVKV